MKTSRRALRMQRHHSRTKRTATLNMVSLMDIFTILVFFLLVSSANVQDVPNAKKIKLPESIANKLPKESVVILVSNEDILVQGKKIASVADVINTKINEIPALRIELRRQSANQLVAVASKDGKPVNKNVTIMGDKEIPYRLLKKIMFTCTIESYGNISLAVMRKKQANG